MLLVFAIQFERAVLVRDLPRLTSISKEGLSMALGFLEHRDMASVEPVPTGSRHKVARLTPKGLEARDAYLPLAEAIEQRWRTHYGTQTIAHLRDALEQLVGTPGAESPLFQGLQPYPDCWRAKVARPKMLPHCPMVLHRGGYPDGA